MRRAGVVDDAAGRLDASDGGAVGVLHPDPHARDLTAGADDAFFKSEGSDAGEQVPTVLIVRHLGSVGPHLEKEIVDVDLGTR